MTNKSKKILAGMAACATMAFCALTVSAASITPPEGSAMWRAETGYGNVNAGKMTKTDNENTSWFSFTSSPENIKVWLTTYVNYNNRKTTASKGVLVELNSSKTQLTAARQGDLVIIESSREHYGNQALLLSGDWKA